MNSVLLKAIAFIFIILLGYGLKRGGVFGKNDYRIMSKIVLNITLPATVIASFAQITLDLSLLYLVVMGVACNLLLAGVGYLSARKRGRTERAFFMINSAGYNIGCFTLPYVQSLLGPAGVVVTCMFDAGNSIMCTGGTFALAEGVSIGPQKGKGKRMLKAMFSSVPFIAYVLSLCLALFGLRIPSEAAGVAAVISEANGFCSMFMIGMMFEIKMEKGYLRDVVQVLAIRFSIATATALLFYYCLPFPLLVRQILVVVSFSPMSVINTIFTERLKGNVGAASVVNSISTVVAIVCITALLMQMNIVT